MMIAIVPIMDPVMLTDDDALIGVGINVTPRYIAITNNHDTDLLVDLIIVVLNSVVRIIVNLLVVT